MPIGFERTKSKLESIGICEEHLARSILDGHQTDDQCQSYCVGQHGIYEFPRVSFVKNGIMKMSSLLGDAVCNGSFLDWLRDKTGALKAQFRLLSLIVHRKARHAKGLSHVIEKERRLEVLAPAIGSTKFC